jgi:hypothetical protein
MAVKKAAESVTEETPAPVPAPVMGYKVVGALSVDGVKKGGFIEQSDLDPKRVYFLQTAGAIGALIEKEA